MERTIERSSQRGFSLLEVLVAGGLAGWGLAALAALMLSALSGTAQSGYRMEAAMLAASLATQIGLSPAAEAVFLSSPPAVVPDCSTGTACSADDFAASNLKRWQLETSASLPGGSGVVCRDGTPQDGTADAPACDGSGRIVIKVFWRAPARPGHDPARFNREL